MQTTILTGTAYGTSEVLKFISHELPPLAPGMARIQVKASGINPIDARRMTGEFRHAALPQYFGTEFAGIITDAAGNSANWKAGDEVLGSGNGFTHATVIDVPLNNLVAKPENMDWQTAGSVAGVAQTATTIWDTLGDVSSVLVHGASGGVGSIFIQLANQDTKVVATASARNQDYLKSLGATPVEYGPGLIERIKAVYPHPFDASVDMAGGEEATAASLACVKKDGALISITGLPHLSPRVQDVYSKRNRANLEYVVDGISKGLLIWEVSEAFPFQNAADAYTSILKKHTRGKSVLVME